MLHCLYLLAANDNARGQTTTIAYGNGATSPYSYNEQRGFLNRVLTVNGATMLIDQSYTRNAKGMITVITRTCPVRSVEHPSFMTGVAMRSLLTSMAASLATTTAEIGNLHQRSGILAAAQTRDDDVHDVFLNLST